MRILTVCSHNRTRSVMSAALLDAMLGEMLGVGAVTVRSSGFGQVGLPAIPDAVAAMARRGLDVSEHRSASTTVELVDGADVILTAERSHVVKIAALSPAAFRRAVTLPELLARAADVDGSIGRDDPDGVARWMEQLTADRGAADYLRAAVPEVADPTGSAPRAFEEAVKRIEQQCREAATLISMAAHR